METIKLIGRSSRPSLLQIDIVKRKIQAEFPDMKVEVIAHSSKGDALQNIPLHTVEGREEMATVFLKKALPQLSANGEYVAIESLAEKNLVNREAGHLDVWTALPRAGVGIIISYAAKNAKEWIDKMEY